MIIILFNVTEKSEECPPSIPLPNTPPPPSKLQELWLDMVKCRPSEYEDLVSEHFNYKINYKFSGLADGEMYGIS